MPGRFTYYIVEWCVLAYDYLAMNKPFGMGEFEILGRPGDNILVAKYIRFIRSEVAFIAFRAYSRIYHVVNSVILILVVVHYKTAAIAIRKKLIKVILKAPEF